MATTAPVANNSKKSASKPSQVLPEERFWKRYSKHHELPLSVSSSIFLHVIILVLLFFGGVLLAMLGLNRNKESLPVEQIVVIAGGGGNPKGIGDNSGKGAIPVGVEPPNENERPKPESAKTIPDQKLEKPDVQPPTILDPAEKSGRERLFQAATSAPKLSGYDSLGEKAKKMHDEIAGRGRGGPGSGGGEGKGRGTGTGKDSGPGESKNNIVNQRQKRQLRWTMIFNTRTGEDYAKQLQGLGAILAIPDGPGKFLLIDNLSRRPVQPKPDDLRNINRIYWIDDKPQSVQSLSKALGLFPPPEQIIAFFPEELEKKLFEKEMQAFRGKNEDDIEATFFRVEQRGGGYEPVVLKVDTKR
jgi:hypothetical protein